MCDQEYIGDGGKRERERERRRRTREGGREKDRKLG